MFQRALTSAVAIAAMLLTTTVAKADFVIDTFTTPDPAIGYTIPTTAGGTFVSGTSVINPGVNRNITVTQVDAVFAGGNGFYGNTGSVAGAAFQMNSPNNGTTFAKLAYTYDNAQNLASGGPVLRFSFDTLQNATPFSVVLSDGTTSATQTGLVLVTGSSSSFAIPLSSFVGTNLNAITSIDLFVNRNVETNSSAPDADVTIRDLRVTQDVPPVDPVVPAPPVAILLLAAAPALGFVRFGRRKLGL